MLPLCELIDAVAGRVGSSLEDPAPSPAPPSLIPHPSVCVQNIVQLIITCDRSGRHSSQAS